MLNLKLSNKRMLPELKKLYQESFCASDSEVDFFFDNKYREENCVVCLLEGKVVSALHMLDTFILNSDREKTPAYYFYAAATFPQYRNKGFMRKTIDYANSVAVSKGQEFSFLMPANENLCKFYEKIGYKQFFKTFFVKLNCAELKKNVGECKGNFQAATAQLNLEKIRFSFYNQEGDVFWSEKDINFAFKQNEFYNGQNVFTDDGYAICARKDDGCVEILELAVLNVTEDVYKIKSLKESVFLLLSKVLQNVRAKEYVLRLPCSLSDLFYGHGNFKNFGMIKNLSGEKILVNATPYLGLTLD